jgi:hypothetical protein
MSVANHHQTSPPALGYVLGNDLSDPGGVEDLPVLSPDHLGAIKVLSSVLRHRVRYRLRIH